MNFEDFSLGSDILQAIGEIGFEIPTPIQEQLIPILMEDDEDVIGLAQTGTGKTAAFGLPLLLRINPEVKSPQALVVCPTRELCVQVAKDITSFSKYLRSISVTAVYGGAPMDAQIRSIKKGTKIIVATPGRLLDLMNRNVINLSAVNFLALDEADTMLSMGFKDEMDAILEQVPPERRTVLLSATMPREVARIASQFMNNPVEIAAGPKNIGASTVEHGYYMVHARDKYAALKRIVDYHPDMYAIVFCRTRAATQEVADKLLQDEYDAEPLHGDLSQAQRDFVMKKFRDRNLQLLIATDIAARGLDVTDLTHVIHYDLPDDQDTYTHRSGRTGRAGKKGISLAIINMKQKYRIRHLEKVAGARFSEMRVPRGEEICERQLMHLVDRVKSVDIDEDRIASYMPIIEQKLDGLDRDTLIRHFVSLEFNRFIDYYRNLPDLTPPQNQPRQDRDGRRSRESSSGDFTVLKLNIGKKEGIFPADVINLVNRFSGKRITLGKIDIGSSDTRMQVDSFAARTLAESLSGTTVKGRKLRVMVQQSSERKTRYPSGGSKSSSKKGPNQSRSGNYSGKRTAKKRPKKSFYGG